MKTDGNPWGDEDAMYRAVVARDRRFDGRFVLGVTTTGIYCRPSCPARTPHPANVRYFVLPAAAVAAGFRACKRCRPDATPGGRLWDHRGDLAARALRLVGSGVVDEHGVAGLAEQLSVSERHLHRTLIDEVGVGPSALARTRRAQTARMLLEQTDLPVTQVAYASGFASVRQFNDVMRMEFGSTPSSLRRTKTMPDRPAKPGRIVLRLAAREPFHGAAVLAFLDERAIPGVEVSVDGAYVRMLPTSAGDVRVRVSPRGDGIGVELSTPELAALRPSVTALRALFDLDADAPAIDDVLSGDPILRALVRARPGLRVPGTVSGFEALVRAVVGQQVSVRGARTLLGRIAMRCGRNLGDGEGISHVFPTAPQLAEADLSGLGLTGRRISTLQTAAQRVVDGRLVLDAGGDLAEQRRELLAVPGIGPWTSEYVAMRALGDPDAFPAEDLALRRVVDTLGAEPDRWRPWRAYAAVHLWTNTHEELT